MEKIWERRADEGDLAWRAFQAYLSGDRNCEIVAKRLQKSAQYIRRLAGQFEWRERARAYDNSLLEETRQELRRRLATTFLKRWQDLDELAAAAADALRAKIPSATPRTLNEILTAASEKQLAMIDKLKILEDTGGAEGLTIKIIDATGGDSAENNHSPTRNYQPE